MRLKKQHCPRDLLGEEERFWWRWERLIGVEVDRGYKTLCHEVDLEESEAGVTIMKNPQGEQRPTYFTRMVGKKNSIVYLARAVLKFVNEYDEEQLPLIAGKSGTEAGHLCDNPTCVRPDHLVIQTTSENQIQASLNGRRSRQKLSPREVINIFRLSAEGLSMGAIARQYDVHVGTISAILSRKTYKYLYRAQF